MQKKTNMLVINGIDDTYYYLWRNVFGSEHTNPVFRGAKMHTNDVHRDPLADVARASMKNRWRRLHMTVRGVNDSNAST